MLSRELLTILLGISSLSSVSLVSANPYHDNHAHYNKNPFHPRNYVTPEQRLDEYDFIIAGGGVAGLVLASRLSENSSTTILVIEAGPSGDAVPTQINVPSSTYYNSLLGAAPYDWLYKTVAQPNAGGRVLAQPRGRVLGGSSAVNGMYMVRPAMEQVNAWHDLIAQDDSSAAAPWGWDNFFTTMKKTEIFTPPVDASEQVAGIKYTASSHGTNGNVHTSYPGYMIPVTGNWLPTLAAAGVSASEDAYGGNNIGGFFATTALNPSNWTRSYSKSAYIDPLPPRANLHIITDATVERVVFSDTPVDGNLVATGVQFSLGAGSDVQSVSAKKEVLVSGGAMGSAHLLQVSGVGPKDILTAAGVPVKVELPGVGQHLIDHLAAGVAWQANVDTQGSIMASGSDLSKSPEFNSFVNSGIAYVNGSLLFGGSNSFAAFRNSLDSSATSAAASRVPSTDSTVVEGYKAIYDATLKSTYPDTGLVEILLSINAAGQVMVQAALQQPLSQGRLYINSSSIYDTPVIDPQYLSHPADITVFRQGIKLARTIGGTAPLNGVLGAEVLPGSAVQTDADVEAWIRTVSGTEYHPAGACGMLPKSLGGVVNAKLQVYGTANLRVIDSSVFPVPFSAHLTSPTYALAETGAQIILAAYSPNASSVTTTTGTDKIGSATTGSDGSAETTKSPSGVVSLKAGFGGLALAGLITSFLL